MQIHEITQLNEQEAPASLGGMIGSSIMGGLAKVMGAGQQDPTKIAASNQQKIDDVAKRALPMWMAKQAQLVQVMGNPNMDEELESWIEQNMLQGRLHVEDLDPAYQSKIKSQIKIVNATSDMNQKRAEFSKLIAATMLARPSRANVGRVAGRTTAQNAVDMIMAMLAGNTRLSSEQARAIGTGLKAQGVTNVPRNVVQDRARGDSQAVETMLASMGITVS